MNEPTGHYCGKATDGAGVTWLLYTGQAVEHGMALELIAIRADATHVRWHGTVWLINLLVTSAEGFDAAAGRGAEFFAKLREHFAAAVKGDALACSPEAFHGPTSDTVH